MQTVSMMEVAWVPKERSAGTSSSSTFNQAAVSLQAERFSCRATAESSQVATLVLVASAGLAGRALRELRHRRKLLQAQGRLVEPPLPPYMQPKADTQGEALVRREKMNLVHPTTTLEEAMTRESLRTLCEALATAEGTISAASAACSNLATLDQDWVPPTKVDSALAIRALLRYGELRHSPGDDLTPKDLSGRSGAGIRALLRICRSYKFEVAAELEFHGDQSMQMIKAFHDQANMISKFMPFFRTTIEKSIPSLLRQQVEPLPRVISYLEPYGEIQLSVLYEAAKDQVIKAQIEQFDPRSLLEVTEKWVSKARSGEIGVIMAHKARVLVRHVVSLDLDMAPSKKAAWMGLALWGSVLEPSDDVVLMEDRLRKGAFFRGDPVEMLSLAERMADVHGLNDEMFQIMRFPLLKAMRMAPEKAAEALASLTFATGKLKVAKEDARLALPERLRKRFKIYKLGEDKPVGKLKKRAPAPPAKPKEAFTLLLVRLMEAFTSAVSFINLEVVLERWVQKNFDLPECEKVTRDGMLKRLLTEENLVDAEGEESLATLANSPSIQPGPLARCSSHLISLGLPAYTLAPAVDWLLGEPAGWAEKKAYPHAVSQDKTEEIMRAMEERRERTGDLAARSLPLLSHLWPDEERGRNEESWNVLPLRDIDELLRLVGPTQEREDDRTRQADLAANRLLQRMSAQLMFPDLEAEVELSMRQWREEQPETTLSTIVAPWLLKSAKMCAESGMPDELPPGALSRSIESLSRTMRLEEISLLSAEWALAPFEKADASSEAITWVSSSCAKGGVAEVILSDACSGWLASGCSLGSLGVEIAVTSLLAWERDSVRDEGVMHLRKAHSYLEQQLALGTLAKAVKIEERLQDAIDSLGALIGAIDGVAPSLKALSKGREGIFSKLSGIGRAALADAVAFSWSYAMPGLKPSLAAVHFDQWFRGLENTQDFVESVVSNSLQDLMGNVRLKVERTFGDQPSDAYSSPSFRVEGIRKVTWFVPTSVVKEAFEHRPFGLRKPPKDAEWPGPGLVRSKFGRKQAEEKGGGRCMYCGGGYKLSPKYFWPHELGGTELLSNVCSRCECCKDLEEALGPRRWGEVLTSSPDEAAEVWWEAQRKANMETVSFLSNQQPPP